MSDNRDDEPGIYVHRRPLDATNARQVIGHRVESTSIHSRSQGWLPSIMVTIRHMPLVGPGEPGELKLMMQHDDAGEFIDILIEGLERAVDDCQYGPREN